MAAPHITGPYPLGGDHSQAHDPRHPSQRDKDTIDTRPGDTPVGDSPVGGQRFDAARFAPDHSIDLGRDARITELAARLVAIESRDRTARPTGVVPAAAVTASGAEGEPWNGAAARTQAARRSGSRGTVPIGSGAAAGTTGPRRTEPGGHPEDAPGDPEAVAKAVCLRLLTAAARPRAALATALRQRGIPDDVAAAVLDRFVEVGLIDDQAYADAFVAAKHRDRALGVTALRTELKRKGVEETNVDAAVQAVDVDAERDRARALISRRVDSAMGNGALAARRRLVGLLARRGYSAELACQVVDEALADYGEPTWDGATE